MPRTLTAPPALGDDLAALRAHFAPMLDRIRAGAVEREIERRLPHEEIRALDEAGFGTLRVPAEHGGPGVSIATLTALLVDLAGMTPAQAIASATTAAAKLMDLENEVGRIAPGYSADMIAVSGIRPLNGAIEMRLRSITPKRVCSMVSFSSPSWAEWKTSTQMRSPVRSAISRPISCTAVTVG